MRLLRVLHTRLLTVKLVVVRLLVGQRKKIVRLRRLQIDLLNRIALKIRQRIVDLVICIILVLGARVKAGGRLPAAINGETVHAVQIVLKLANGDRVALELLTVRFVDVDFFLCDFDVLAVMMCTNEVE